MKTVAGRIRLLALGLLALGTLSISGCVGLTSATNPSGQQKQNTPGSAAMAVSPSSINFGSVAVGSVVSQSITVSNTGGSNLSVTQDSISTRGFAVTGMSLPMTIGAGGQSTLNVVFSPKQLGRISGAVSVMSNASKSPASVNVSGTGVAATSLLKASSASLSFGSVVLGGSSVMGITFTNAGNSNVSISKVSISGAGFTASGVSPGMILAPGQNTTLNVTFSPTVAGTVTGSIIVASDATNSPTIISLSGSGVRASLHSATLSWTPSTSALVGGYNVYRSIVSGGPYARMTSSPVTTSSYTDFTVEAGHIYYYVVTSLTADTESSESSQVSAAIPAS